MKNASLIFFLFIITSVNAQRDYTNSPIDVLHYTFTLQLSDEDNIIKGDASISIKFTKNCSGFDLDLVNQNSSGKGMHVSAVKENNTAAVFLQETETIHIGTSAKAGDTLMYNISYQGIPADGLIIDKNKYGHRTFFGDNWPNRAHHWLPCVDNPLDKASVDFIVTAPGHYQVVANGLQVEENNLPGQLKQTHWKETVNLPTKVMVIGAADFAVNYAGDVDCIPVYSWVYPEDKTAGFYDYALAKDILPYFIKNVGPYAYRKLANVQSKTQFGGMENASTIFYFENSVQGDRKLEALLTHEIAHQWFGNSATEASWPHVWLSEGFATCMTHLYLENKYGHDTLQKRMAEDRETVIAFSKKKYTPIVDTSITRDFFQLLNANSYQKGGWVLHMLRRKLGDAVFWKGLQNYYAAFAGRNATTDDFRKSMEVASGQDLQLFFQQWLYTAGHPVLKTSWKYNTSRKTLSLRIEQTQPAVFNFPLELSIQTAGAIVLYTYTLPVKEKITLAEIPLAASPGKIVLDPNINLLFETAAPEKK